MDNHNNFSSLKTIVIGFSRYPLPMYIILFCPEPRGYVDGGLHWADYVIFSLFLCISLGIGFFYACTGGRQRTTKEFIMADRKLNIVPTMLSLLVSHQSAIMILGNAAEMYTRGSLAWLWMSISFLFSVFICERIVIPWLYPLGLTSIYEVR